QNGCTVKPPSITNLTLRNNLIYDSSSTWGQGSDICAMTMSEASVNLTVDHNTVIHTASHGGGCTIALDSVRNPPQIGLVMTNNMLRRETYGIHDVNGEGSVALQNNAAGGVYTFLKNAVADAPSSIYPANNFYDSSAVWQSQFVNYTPDGGPNTDYHIQGGSTYHNAGTDGKDVGADITAVDNATSCVITGGICSSLTITTTTVPNGTVGSAYSFTMQAQGGVTPYAWSISAGSLPPGLSLSTGGDLTGTPTTAGTYNYTLSVIDSASASDTQPIAHTIAATPPPEVVI